jgi:hypothetical protein
MMYFNVSMPVQDKPYKTLPLVFKTQDEKELYKVRGGRGKYKDKFKIINGNDKYDAELEVVDRYIVLEICFPTSKLIIWVDMNSVVEGLNYGGKHQGVFEKIDMDFYNTLLDGLIANVINSINPHFGTPAPK